MLGTADDVIDALGGTKAASDKLGRTPQAVTNWRASGRIPSKLFLTVRAALEAAGKPPAAPDVFGMTTPEPSEAA